MKYNLTGLSVLIFAILKANAQSSPYGQCGGSSWTGSTTCVAGWVCTYSNPYYSQCLQGTSSSSSSSSTTVASSTTSLPPSSTSTVPAQTGFVKVSGTKFTLNGANYPLLGFNAYWVGTIGLSAADLATAFSDVVKSGGTTVRTWGFNDVTTASGYYYQSWSGATPTINTGATGLGAFDLTVAAAKAAGIRLIVPLTNNWGDYGGMDVYVKQITGTTTHSLFYTDARVIAAYKNYIKVFVSRYLNEPTILAWELGNEPRCNGCATSIIFSWATTISAYIKSLDPNHLVTLGDEGFYNQTGASTYPYQGGEGIDFDANLKISTLDFGTAHLYPVSWGQTADPTAWGTQWILDHAASQKAANKPVILEEFGVTEPVVQNTTYAAWFAAVESSGLTGDLIWQLGTQLSYGPSNDDGYAIYNTDPVYAELISHNAAMKKRG